VQQDTKGVVDSFICVFVANFILFLTVQEFWWSVKFWPSYSKSNLAHF